ncbi:MAG: hypothetical protein WAW52_06885 [Methanothrix sp.]
MENDNLPEFIKTYFGHPLVQKANKNDLMVLDEKLLNEIIQAEDLIYRGIREYYKADKDKKLNAGHFGSSVQIARAWSLLDMAFPSCDLGSLIDRVYMVTKTTDKKQYLKHMKDSVLPRLIRHNLIILDESKNIISDFMPYAVSSKLYVKKELLDNTILFSHQANQFTILNKVQYFPVLKTELEANATIPGPNFGRDYNALSEIDVIRTRSIKGRDFTLSKAYLTGDRSLETWLSVLESADRTRKGLKQLLELQGIMGGCVSQNEISRLTSMNMRLVGNLMRRIDALGLAQRIQTLELDDALSRPISGTRLNSNYSKLNNAQSMLIFARSITETPDILYKVRKQQVFNEGELSAEFDPSSVSKVRNSLQNIGVLIEEDEAEGIWKVAQNNESNAFLDDVLKVLANTRSILGENLEINKRLEDFFPDNEEDTNKNLKELEKDFLKVDLDKK